MSTNCYRDLMEESDDIFVKCLSIPSNLRTLQDVFCIRSYFKSIEALKNYKELTISEFARIARYEHYEAQSTLYRHGDICTSWYIVLSGCVLVGQTMFFPRKSFGHRSQGNLYRYDECVILEETELIVFDYSLDRHTQNSSSMKPIDSIADSNLTLSNALLNSPYGGSHSKRSSHASDTSSAFSGCDLSSENKANSSFGNVSYTSDNDEDDPDVDSLSQDVYSVNDSFYDVILKDPSQRTDSDVETILEGIQNLAAFNNFTSKTKYELCRVMRVAVVSNANEKLIDDGHLHDTWNVIIEGTIEVRYKDGSVKEYSRGDSFGVRPTNEEQRQNGDMWTITPTCLFFCVLQQEFCDIISRNTDAIIPETEDNGRVVLVYEERKLSSTDSSKTGRVIVKGRIEKLINCLLVDQNKTDPMYIENFLLAYRVFIKSPKVLAEKFCQCYETNAPGVDTRLKAMIRKCLLLWANSHFSDLDDPNADMDDYLERFDQLLSDGDYSARDRVLYHMACSSNSKPRFLTINVEKNFMKQLPFRLIGLQRGRGLFVKEINKMTAKLSCGLRRGDQILTLANYSWERLDSLDKAVDLLNSNSSCSINMVVKYNPTGFQDVLDEFSDCESGMEYDYPSAGSLAMSGSVTLHGLSDHLRSGLNCVITPMAVPRPHEFTPSSPSARPKNNTRSANTSPNRQIVRQRSKPKCNPVMEKANQPTIRPLKSLNNRSSSNPDLKPLDDGTSSNSHGALYNTNQVLKVFRQNSTDNKLVLLTGSTTAKEAVVLIMKEFSIDHSEADNYALYLISVDIGVTGPVVKSSRVAPYMKDLAGKLALNQRYYLKHNQTESLLITDEQAKILLNETKVNISQLSAFEIATRLTFIDYTLFRDIQAAEYINFILKLPPLEEADKLSDTSSDVSKSDQSKDSIDGFSTGYENYEKFEDLINRESFWPTTEICQETNVNKRAELIKKFIKTAKICKDLKNFNSLMCIITGLTLTPVSRLKASWEKVSSKYLKIYEELSFLTDMSFNFRQIRQLVSPDVSEPPIIPCLAIHSKDLATIHMGNKTCAKDGLINFEKLRMMASEIRKLTNMCSTVYNLPTIISAVRNRNAPSFFPLTSPGPTTNPSLDESDATSGISGCSNNSDSCSKKLRSNSVDQFAFNGTLKKKYIKRKSLSIIETQTKNPKKIYEEWLSTLKVRTYLLNLNVEMNINRLQDLSHLLEPSSSIISSSGSISASATSLEPQTNTDQTANLKMNSSTKSSVTINLSQTKSQSPIVVSNQPQSTTVTSPIVSPVSPKPCTQPARERPQSIFSCQNQEHVDKLMELVQVSKKVTKRRQIVTSNDTNLRHRGSNGAADQNYLRNLPMYHNNKHLIQELSLTTAMRQERNNNPLPGGVTLNLQQPSSDTALDKPISDKAYCYPLAGGPINNYYYGGDRRKCMKPDLPSYETARAISQHQKLIPSYRSVVGNTDTLVTRPPMCPKQPQLPSYNQYLTRSTNHPEVAQQIKTKRSIPPPPPPPRTVTMPQTCKTSLPLTTSIKNQVYELQPFQKCNEPEDVIHL